MKLCFILLILLSLCAGCTNKPIKPFEHDKADPTYLSGGNGRKSDSCSDSDSDSCE